MFKVNQKIMVKVPSPKSSKGYIYLEMTIAKIHRDSAVLTAHKVAHRMYTYRIVSVGKQGFALCK